MKLKHPGVLVAGAGPVGLFTALRLAREGLSVQVVERAEGPATHSYALALHPRSLSLLDEVGVARPVLESALRVHSIGLYEGSERRSGLDYGALHEAYPFLAVLQQDALERHLVAALKRAGVEILWSHRLAIIEPDRNGVNVEVDQLAQRMTGYAFAHLEWSVARKHRARVPFVVGADGHRSLVRLQSKIAFEEVAAPEHFAVFEFESNASPASEMRLVLLPETTNVVWPLPGGLRRWSFQLTEFDASAYSREKDRQLVQLGEGGYPLLNPAHLRELLEERAPWFERRGIGEIRWRIAVRFEKRLAGRFGEGRVWLVGDAAHMTGPAGVQSMNMGLREADALAPALAEAHRTSRMAALREYDATFRQEWRELLGIDAAPAASGGADPWIASQAARLVPCLPATGENLHALVGQLHLQCA